MSNIADINNSLVNLQNNTANVNAERNKEAMGSSSMGQDAFLQLLMAQLKYQDPMNPSGSDQMIQQQAALSQVQELQNLNANLTTANEMTHASNQIMQASSLIGKEATVNVATDELDENGNTVYEEKTGIVTEAKFGQSGASIMIGEEEYGLDTIQSVRDNQTI